MMLRMRVDPARMQLLLGFFESYLDLTSQEEEIFQQKLKEELPMEEVKEVTEILTSYHLRGKEEGREEGREEGGVLALQSTLLKLARKKFGSVSSETEKLIHETNSSQKLENILENIFEIESENSLVEMLREN